MKKNAQHNWGIRWPCSGIHDS